MKVTVYGRTYEVLGYYADPAHPAYMRLLLDGGRVYWHAHPNMMANSERAPLDDFPREVSESADGNGDLLTYANGKQYQTGGGVIPFSKSDMDYALANRQLEAAQSPAAPEPKTNRRPAVTIKEAAVLCKVSARTIKNWEARQGTPEGWPGRADPLALGAFAATRESQQRTKKALAGAVRVGRGERLSTQDRQHREWQEGMKRKESGRCLAEED